jgi:hypothetical protein
MNNVVRIGGFALIALGVLAILLNLVMGESVRDLSFDTGATLLAGGFITLGLSNLVAAIETLRAYFAAEEPLLETSETSAVPMSRPFAESLSPLESAFKSRGNVQGARVEEPEPASPRLDTARPVEERFTLVRENPPLPPEPEVEDVHDYEQVPDEAVSEEELYVVEERTIAGKPARILSDGTVEAETDDGWMRFENVEHLEEYMEAVRSQHG